MKNIFNKGPIFAFQVVVAITLVILSYTLVGFFMKESTVIETITELPAPPEIVQKEKIEFVSPNELGIVHIELDSPSYAKSNFDINPETEIFVYYNLQPDPQSVLSGFALVNKNTEEEMPVEVSFVDRQESDDQDNYNWEWQRVWERKLIFTSSEKLKPVTMYEVLIQMGSDKVFSYEFLTADDPGILSTNLDNRDLQIERGEPVKIIFKSPMDSKELKSKTKIYPEGVSISIGVTDKIMTIEGAFNLRSYQLVIPSDTKDIYGRELGREFLLSFEVI